MLASLLLASLPQQILIVDDNAAVPGVFTDLQLAIDTAQPGDTVYVRSGQYGTDPFAPVDLSVTKGIELIGLPDATGELPRVRGLSITGVDGGQVLVSGFRSESFNASWDITDCSAPVVLRDLELRSWNVRNSGAVEANRVRCTAAVELEDSAVSAWDLEVEPVTGTPGIRAENSVLYLALSSVRGGPGADGVFPSPFDPCSSGGPGRTGLQLLDSLAYLLEADLAGGPGGQPVGGGSCTAGSEGLPVSTSGSSSVITLPTSGVEHRLSLPRLLRDGEPIELSVTGDAGDLAVLLFSNAVAPIFLPTWSASLSPSAASLKALVLGAIEPDGDLHITLGATLPVGVDQAVRFAQAALVDPLDPTLNLAGAPDVLRIVERSVPLDDCNRNGLSDAVEFPAGLPDCNGNGILDACEIDLGTVLDCNSNGVPDACDIALGTSFDLGGDGIPDECQTLEVPGQFPDLASALAAAPDNSEIVLAPGFYTGPGFRNLTVNNARGLVLRGTPGAASDTVIDAELGGRILEIKDSEVWLRDLTLLGGRASAGQGFTNGGNAVLYVDSAVRIERCTFAFNFGVTVTDKGGAVLQLLNGPLVQLPAAVIRDTTFARNSTNDSGGALAFDFLAGGTMVPVDPPQLVRIERCVFEGNGGYDGAPPINPAGQRGGACLFEGARVELANSLFQSNFTQGRGGAIAALACDVSLRGVTFVDNTAARADDFLLTETSSSIALANVRNSIFARSQTVAQAPEAILVNGSGLDLDYCHLQGGAGDVVLSTTVPSSVGPNLISGPVGFEDPVGLDFRLGPGSAAIDAGDPSFLPAPFETDLDGNPRLVGPAVDLGAYERP